MTPEDVRLDSWGHQSDAVSTMENTMTNADFDKIQIYRFRSHELAFNFADRAVKAHMVLLGDDDRYWVVRMSDGERLLRAGYEAAPRIF